MMRWRIERDYLDLKQEVGLGHFEGRGWMGFHHHATMCIAAYGFLISERGAFPPSEAQSSRHVLATAVPESYRPRGAPLRPERHVPDSIATLRRRLVVGIAQRLPRCPLLCDANPNHNGGAIRDAVRLARPIKKVNPEGSPRHARGANNLPVACEEPGPASAGFSLHGVSSLQKPV